VAREDGQTAFWKGARGGIVAEARYSPDRPERVTVKRYVPAPF
jgi:predicted nicotinamide N-methyase